MINSLRCLAGGLASWKQKAGVGRGLLFVFGGLSRGKREGEGVTTMVDWGGRGSGRKNEQKI